MKQLNHTTESEVTNSELNESPRKKSSLWIMLAMVLVLVLVGAAFIGGKMLGQQKMADTNSESDINFIEAEELPDEEPQVTGNVTKVDGDTLTVMSFNMDQTLGDSGGADTEVIEIELDEDGEIIGDMPSFFGGDGEEVEIVITNKTEVYKDITDIGDPIMLDPGQGIDDAEMDLPDTIEMEIEEASADDIGPNSMVTVWGERKGDRVIASFVLFTPPFSFEIPD